MLFTLFSIGQYFGSVNIEFKRQGKENYTFIPAQLLMTIKVNNVTFKNAMEAFNCFPSSNMLLPKLYYHPPNVYFLHIHFSLFKEFLGKGIVLAELVFLNLRS